MSSFCPFSYFHDRTAVRSGAEIVLLRLRLNVSQGASLGDFLLAPVCPMEKVTLWEGLLYLTSGFVSGESSFYALPLLILLSYYNQCQGYINIDLLSFLLCVSQHGALLWDFLLAPWRK